MQRHACSNKLLAPMVNFKLKKILFFLYFMGTKNTQFSNLSYFGKLQILGCYRPCLLYWLLWLRMSNPWVSKDSRVVVAIMQVRCFFWPGISSIPGAFSMGGHPFRCHSLWSSLIHRCCCNLNQKILNNVEVKVRVR